MNAILKLILYCVHMHDCVCGNVLDCHCQRIETAVQSRLGVVA